MLSKRLEELSRDPSDPDSIVELAVTALGPQGSFYICWKTRSGEYKQEGHGLPPKLQEWLFPSDNSQRDFGTLQVILGPREGEFLASDQNGKVDQKPTEPSPRPFGGLARASTFAPRDTHSNPKSSSSRSRRISFVVAEPDASDKASRRRSATLTTLGWAPNANRRTLSLPKVPVDPTETEEQRKSRRTSLLPLTLQTQTGPTSPVASPSGSEYTPNETLSRSSSLRSSPSSHSLSSISSREGRGSSGNSPSDHLSSQETIVEDPQRTPRPVMPQEPQRTPRPAIPQEPQETPRSAIPQEFRRTPRPVIPQEPQETPRSAIPQEFRRTPPPATPQEPQETPRSAVSQELRRTPPPATPQEPQRTPRPVMPEERQRIPRSVIPQSPPRIPRPVIRRPRPVSCYADACVQTDVLVEEDEPETPMPYPRHIRGRSSVSSASSVFSAGSDYSSRRTSVASDFKVDDGNCWADEKPSVVMENPVRIGRMQEYFRHSTYQLGDAFQGASTTYWGSWR